MDISCPVSRAQAHRFPVSLETVTLTTGEQANEARRHRPFPTGGGREQDVLGGHDGRTSHLCRKKE